MVLPKSVLRPSFCVLSEVVSSELRGLSKQRSILQRALEYVKSSRTESQPRGGYEKGNTYQGAGLECCIALQSRHRHATMRLEMLVQALEN